MTLPTSTPRSGVTVAHLGISFEPPSTDQYEEQARYDCMQLVRDGRLDGPNVLTLRDVGVGWSTIRDEATAGRSSDPHSTAAVFIRLSTQMSPHGRTHRHTGSMTEPEALRQLSTALQSYAQELRWSAQEARRRSIALRDFAEKVRRTGSAARTRSDQATLRLGYLQVLMPRDVSSQIADSDPAPEPAKWPSQRPSLEQSRLHRVAGQQGAKP
jgi:hypothetical protein